MSGILVLGSGYLGSILAAHDPDSTHTSRDPGARPGDRRWMPFDAARAETWSAVAGRRFAGILVAFPLSHDLALDALWRVLDASGAPVAVIGSTSAFGAATNVTDTTPIDSDDHRASAEERWRQCGAIVLHSAGIYGPGRNPLDWLRAGRIRNLSRIVNLVHVDDLARAALFALTEVQPGTRLVISDGRPRQWAEIAEHAETRGWLRQAIASRRPQLDEGYRVHGELLARLGFTLEHPDLLLELERLESARAVTDLPPAPIGGQ